MFLHADSDAQADLSLRWAHSHFVGFVMRLKYFAFFLWNLYQSLLTGPKIKFYLLAIAYLPTLLPPTQLFFFLFQNLFFVWLFQYFSFSLKYKLYQLIIRKNKKKKKNRILLSPTYYLCFFYDDCLIYLLFNVGEVTLYSPTNLPKKKQQNFPTYLPTS